MWSHSAPGVVNCPPAMDGDSPQLSVHGAAARAAGQASARLGARTPGCPGDRGQELLQWQPTFPLQGAIREDVSVHSGSPQQGEWWRLLMHSTS